MNPPSPDDLLAEYLAVDSPVQLVTIGTPMTATGWLDGHLALDTIQHFDTLADYVAQRSTPETQLVAPAPTAAFLAIDANNGGVSELLGQAVRQFPDTLAVCTDQSDIPETLFFSFGFQRMGAFATSESPSVAKSASPARAAPSSNTDGASHESKRLLESGADPLTSVPLRWFVYRLRDYKQPPSWLNARFWANPERYELDDESDIYCEDDNSEEE